MVRLGDVPLSDAAGIARLVATALPPAGAQDARRVRGRRIRAFMQDHGRHVFTQRLLGDGVSVDLGDGQELVVTLDLDMQQVHNLRAVETELTPVGQKRHHAVEADHQMQAGWRHEAGNERDIAVTANALVAFGAPLRHPHLPFQATVGGTLTGSSTASYTQGYDIVSGTKRAPRFEGESAYFDFRGAWLRTTIRQAGQPTPPDQPGEVRLTARMAFPEEVAPLKQPGDPAGAFREQPRLLPGSRRYGFSQADVDNDAPGGPVREAATRLGPLLNHVLMTPEWVGGGLAELR